LIGKNYLSSFFGVAVSLRKEKVTPADHLANEALLCPRA
jgi:hypothetical protein